MNQLIRGNLGGARLSNFELLRLLCMMMVLNLHSFHGYNHGTGVLQALDFFRESTSICAVDTFILISGYFGIKWRKKGLFNLLFQVLFYSFAVYGVCVATGILHFHKGELIHCFKAFYDGWVFITCYIILYFFSPCLNAFAEKVDRIQLLSFIVIIWLAEVFVMRSTIVFNYFLVYMIGRWMSKVELNKIYGNCLIGYFVTTLIIFFCSYTLYKLFNLSAETMCNLILGYSYANPFIILQSVFLFLFFKSFKFQSRAINWCASSCLSIYLIHMHPSINVIGYYAYTESLYAKPFIEHVFLLFFLIIIVFVGSIIIDKVRMFISEFIFMGLNWGWNSWVGEKVAYIANKRL